MPQLQRVIVLHRLPSKMWSFLAHPCVLNTIQLMVAPDQQGSPAVNIIANPTEHLLVRSPCFPLHSKYSHCLFIESKIKARKDHCDHLTSNQKPFQFCQPSHSLAVISCGCRMQFTEPPFICSSTSVTGFAGLVSALHPSFELCLRYLSQLYLRAPNV